MSRAIVVLPTPRDCDKKPQEKTVNISLMPPHILSRAKWYRLTYLLIVSGILVLVVTTPRTMALDHDGSWSSGYVALLAIWFSITWIVFWSLQASNPGYFTINQGCQQNIADLNMIDVELRAPVSFNSYRDILRDEESSDDESSDEEDTFELEIEPNEELDSQLSQVPLEKVPIRSKFCRNSQMYVASYDHFCGILGTCIGERNHFRFWCFLLANTIGLCISIVIVHSGFRDTRALLSTWINYNGHAFAATMLLSLLLIPIGSLLVFHSFLACASMTSYEFLRSEKISYLKGTRDFDLPFSKGIRFNLKRFCILDGLRLMFVSEWKPRVWETQRIDRESEDVWQNMWENKYWSCC